MGAPLFIRRDGRLRLPPDVHHLEDLLDLEPEQILDSFRRSQAADFDAVLRSVAGGALAAQFAELRALAPSDSPLHGLQVFSADGLSGLFHDLHDHVMSHPVWRHPFFLRFFAGRFTREQLVAFALGYFNQIKNTRQCVALALGRFNGLMGLPYAAASERVSELTQIALAQLVADEYGVGAHALADYPPLDRLFQAQTHIVMYRKLFDGLGVPLAAQDVPMLPEVADNVLTQRLLAGDPVFTPLEALASVGLGMEWGVPEFFSLLLGGVIRFAEREAVPVTHDQVEVLTAHVKYDVLHAVSVMLVTALHMREEGDLAAVKGACNALMAARHGMMSGLYRHVFGEPCATLADIGLEQRYWLTDRRIGEALTAARGRVAPSTVGGGEDYRRRTELPFLFTR